MSLSHNLSYLVLSPYIIPLMRIVFSYYIFMLTLQAIIIDDKSNTLFAKYAAILKPRKGI